VTLPTVSDQLQLKYWSVKFHKNKPVTKQFIVCALSYVTFCCVYNTPIKQ